MIKNPFWKIVFLFLFLWGCSGARNVRPPIVHDTSGFVKGRLVDAMRFKQGGTIFLEPFVAGVGVASTDELDRMSLRIVRGIGLTLTEQESALKLFDGEDVSRVDLILEGRITKWQTPRLFKKFVFIPTDTHMSVEGKIVDNKTKKTILLFSHTRAFKAGGHQTWDVLAETLGKDIGRFILSHLK